MNNFAEKMDALFYMNRHVATACELALVKTLKEKNPKMTCKQIDGIKVVGWNIWKDVDPSKSWFHVCYTIPGVDGWTSEIINQAIVEKCMPIWDTGYELVEKSKK